jgi:hypothetical protein
VRLVPYRYPRPDMGRMKELIGAAARAGVRIVNLSLGSDKPYDWRAFEAGARAHPEMLFIASAGNNGRDIDSDPVFPAALPLENLITVTSSRPDGTLARGSNWGARAVDLLVPAERLAVTDFSGRARLVSGSSYGSPRIAALAACLLAGNPKWLAPELKAAIFALAEPPPESAGKAVAVGFIRDPEARKRGACEAVPSRLVVTARHQVTPDSGYFAAGARPTYTHTFTPTFALIRGSGWNLQDVSQAAHHAAGVLAQCGIVTPGIELVEMDGPDIFRYFLDEVAAEMVHEYALPKPTVYFLKDTLQKPGFDAEAIGRGNSRERPALRDTVWITRAIPHPGTGLAHELLHVLMDSGAHDDDPGNLMHERLGQRNDRLSPAQCRLALKKGEANGLLTRLR